MRIGVPSEVKASERRVALTPTAAHELVRGGHEVVVQAGAGDASGFGDDEYRRAGAVLGSTADAWGCDLVLKVKEPIESEFEHLAGQTLFAYLHLAVSGPLVEALLRTGTTAIAYEAVEAPDGSRPVLAPMSEIAGRLSVLFGAHQLTAHQGGRGVLLGGVPGVPPADVVVLGAGIAGGNAVAQAVGAGARVSVLDLSVPRLRDLDDRYGGRVTTVASTPIAIERAVVGADLVIGAVLVPGSRAPKLVPHEAVERMRPGSVLVDIAIDQGGCFEDSRPTTHDTPAVQVAGSRFVGVTNMPSAVPRTATEALVNATLPYVTRLATLGTAEALRRDPGLAIALSTADGTIRHAPTAEAFPDLPASLPDRD